MTNLKWKASLADNGQQAIPVILVSKDENGDYIEGNSIGGGFVIDDEGISETTAWSSQKTVDFIFNQLDGIGVLNSFELPTEGSSGQRVYVIGEEREYTFRGAYSSIKSILGNTIVENNGNSITTNEGVVITVSSSLAGTSIAQAIDGDENTGWKPDPTDTNPTITVDFNGAMMDPYPKVLAYVFNKNSAEDKGMKIEKYNMEGFENEVLLVKENRILNEDVYQAHSNMDSGHSYHKISFNTSEIEIKNLKLVTGLWVPVY